jgi:hypothetical protein
MSQLESFPPRLTEDTPSGTLMTFERHHTDAHETIEKWEAKLGGAVCHCAICNLPIALMLIVVDEKTIPENQMEWITSALIEAQPLN